MKPTTKKIHKTVTLPGLLRAATKNWTHGDRIAHAASTLISRTVSAAKMMKESDDLDESYSHMRGIHASIAAHLEKHPEDEPTEENKHSYPIRLATGDMCKIFGYSNCGSAIETINTIFEKLQEDGYAKYYPCVGNPKYDRDKIYRPAMLILVGPIWRDTPIRATITLSDNKKASNEPEKHKADVADNIVADCHRQFMDFVTAPCQEELVIRAEELVASGAKTKSGKSYVYDPNQFGVNPNYYETITQHDYINNSICKIVTAIDKPSMTPLLGRTYTSWSAMPKWVRAQYRLKGEKIISIDATALHPCIIGKILRTNGIDAPDFLNGDSHQKLAELVGMSRDEVKKINLTYWNAPKGKYDRVAKHKQEPLKRLHAYMDANHTELLVALKSLCDKHDLLYDYGENSPPIKPHARLYWLMCNIEVKMIREVLARLREKGIIANSCFDAIHVRESDVEQATVIFNDVLREMDILTTAKSEKSEK